MSKREEMRKRRQQQTQRRMLTAAGVIALIAVAVAGWLIYQNIRPIGSYITVPTQTWPQADGKALGEIMQADASCYEEGKGVRRKFTFLGRGDDACSRR